MTTNINLLKNLTVLYVEDDIEISEQMVFFLKKRVGKLIVAKNGKEGLELFKEYLPDLIISDLKMPILDGIGMTRQVRSISDIPIIITTAFSDKEIILKAVDLGIENYVLKPIDVRELVNVMEKAAIRIFRGKGTLLKVRDKILASNERTKIEDEIKNSFAKIIKDKTGKGPRNVKAFIYEDRLEIEIIDAFTKMEKTLLENEKNISIVKYNREVFYNDCEVEVNKILENVFNCEFKLKSVEIDIVNDINRLKFTLL